MVTWVPAEAVTGDTLTILGAAGVGGASTLTAVEAETPPNVAVRFVVPTPTGTSVIAELSPARFGKIVATELFESLQTA